MFEVLQNTCLIPLPPESPLFVYLLLLTIYEFLLKTTATAEDKQKGSLVTSGYTIFHGATTKTR